MEGYNYEEVLIYFSVYNNHDIVRTDDGMSADDGVGHAAFCGGYGGGKVSGRKRDNGLHIGFLVFPTGELLTGREEESRQSEAH